MCDGFVLRAMAPEDAEALRAIYNHAVVHTTATFDVDERSAGDQEVWMKAHDGNPYPAIVAVDRQTGAVIGFASLSQFSSRCGYIRSVENSVYVHPDWHGNGIGGALLAELIATARLREFTTIVALIAGENEASLRLHHRLGFVDAGLLRRVGWKFGREIDVAYLQLFLHEAPQANAS